MITAIAEEKLKVTCSVYMYRKDKRLRSFRQAYRVVRSHCKSAKKEWGKRQ